MDVLGLSWACSYSGTEPTPTDTYSVSKAAAQREEGTCKALQPLVGNTRTISV
jgi:hypothetical protein